MYAGREPHIGEESTRGYKTSRAGSTVERGDAQGWSRSYIHTHTHTSGSTGYAMTYLVDPPMSPAVFLQINYNITSP